ncbi:glycosyltransferase family 4 protein [Neobacillus vireti]|uniref:glycosyltransferase family 4 protein n=1 Tax=Neobacillus vireti TaxID=220686 RepID=UPI002FFD8825
MKQKIYINGRFLTQRITGVQRVAEEIVKKLDDKITQVNLGQKIEFVILTPKNTLRSLPLKNIKVKSIGFLEGHLWEQFLLPFYCINGLLLNFCNTAPVIKRNQIVYIHDAAVFSKPEGYSRKFVAIYKLILSILARKSKKVITVSDFSKEELQTYLPALKGKINTVYLGIDHMYQGKIDNNIFKKHSIIPGDYMLAVSSMHPNKNFQVVLEALRRIENFKGQFVIAGGIQKGVFSSSSIKLDTNVKHVGYVSDEELKALYKNAKAFIFPSIYEGFGLPPLEAMSLGCPVLAANAASIPEVCGDAPLYFNPYEPESLVGLIKSIYKDQELVQNLKKKSETQSEKYRWEQTAQKLINIIENSK